MRPFQTAGRRIEKGTIFQQTVTETRQHLLPARRRHRGSIRIQVIFQKTHFCRRDLDQRCVAGRTEPETPDFQIGVYSADGQHTAEDEDQNRCSLGEGQIVRPFEGNGDRNQSQSGAYDRQGGSGPSHVRPVAGEGGTPLGHVVPPVGQTGSLRADQFAGLCMKEILGKPPDIIGETDPELQRSHTEGLLHLCREDGVGRIRAGDDDRTVVLLDDREPSRFPKTLRIQTGQKLGRNRQPFIVFQDPAVVMAGQDLLERCPGKSILPQKEVGRRDPVPFGCAGRLGKTLLVEDSEFDQTVEWVL